jgi:prevent-host-death family protein
VYAKLEMVTVGVREFRANLRAFMERASRGEEILITDHGKAVAKVLPASDMSVYDRLVAEGRIRPARRRKTPIDRESLPRVRGNAVSDIVIKQRG